MTILNTVYFYSSMYLISFAWGKNEYCVILMDKMVMKDCAIRTICGGM